MSSTKAALREELMELEAELAEPLPAVVGEAPQPWGHVWSNPHFVSVNDSLDVTLDVIGQQMALSSQATVVSEAESSQATHVSEAESSQATQVSGAEPSSASTIVDVQQEQSEEDAAVEMEHNLADVRRQMPVVVELDGVWVELFDDDTCNVVRVLNHLRQIGGGEMQAIVRFLGRHSAFVTVAHPMRITVDVDRGAMSGDQRFTFEFKVQRIPCLGRVCGLWRSCDAHILRTAGRSSCKIAGV